MRAGYGPGVGKGDVRQRNHQVAELGVRKGFVSRLPFVCECSDEDCYEFVMLHPRDYRDRRERSEAVILDGHRPPELAEALGPVSEIHVPAVGQALRMAGLVPRFRRRSPSEPDRRHARSKRRKQSP